MNHILKNEHYTLTVAEYGAEMISLKDKSGKELIWQNPTGEFWNDHSPLLFPVCGRLIGGTYTYGGEEYGMPMHGFAKLCGFKAVEKSDTKIVLSIKETEETLKMYPFEFEFTATYELSGDKLLFSVKVTNNSDKTMPYMFGWHPGFNLPVGESFDINDYRAEFKGLDTLGWHPIPGAGEVILEDIHPYALDNSRYNFCEEEIYSNDTMIFVNHNNECSVYVDGQPFRIDMSWSENLPVLCIWKQDDHRAKFVCIEPWTCYKKSQNFDTAPMPRLESGKSEVFSYTVSVKN